MLAWTIYLSFAGALAEALMPKGRAGFINLAEVSRVVLPVVGHPYIPGRTDTDIDLGMAGNICRCGTYLRIRDAVKKAANSLNGKGE